MMFWAPRLSAMMMDFLELMIINSTLLSESPSLLLCEVAVDSSGSSFGTSRRLTLCFLRADFKSRPVF